MANIFPLHPPGLVITAQPITVKAKKTKDAPPRSHIARLCLRTDGNIEAGVNIAILFNIYHGFFRSSPSPKAAAGRPSPTPPAPHPSGSPRFPRPPRKTRLSTSAPEHQRWCSPRAHSSIPSQSQPQSPRSCPWIARSWRGPAAGIRPGDRRRASGIKGKDERRASGHLWSRGT